MSKAVIDLGTNTFHLLIAEVEGTNIREIYKEQVPVKIGQGGISKGKIAEDAFLRGMQALEGFAAALKKYQVNSVKAFATSAIRNASNGKEFTAAAFEKHGIRIEAISGDEEAACIFEGVRHSYEMEEEQVMVMDIGGGSVEFITGNGRGITWKKSFEIGAARLIGKFHTQDPIDKEGLAGLKDYLLKELEPLSAHLKKNPVQVLAGSAGSFETLRDVIRLDIGGETEKLSGHATVVFLPDVIKACELFVRLNQGERLALKGMTDFRAEMISVAAVLMQHVIDAYGIKRIIASDYSLKEGMLLSL